MTKINRLEGLVQTELNEEQKSNSKLNFEEMQKRMLYLKSNPRRVILELTNRCDLRCIMCGRTFQGFCNPTNLNLGIIKKFDSILETAEEITLFGWGEPLVNPNFIMMMDELKKYPDLRRYVLTNGTTLDVLKDIIIKYRLDLLSISVDGATANTHDKIRRGSSLNLIIKNLKEIMKLQAENVNIPYIDFAFTLMERNIRELPELIKLAYQLQIPEIKCVYLTAFKKGFEKESLWNHQALCKEIFEISKDEAKNLGINLRLPAIIGEDPLGNLTHKKCDFPWRDIFIGSDGFIRPCMHTVETIAHYNEFENIKELWNHRKFQDFRAKVDGVNMPINCKYCYQSSFANYNKEYAHIQTGKEYIYKF